MFGGHDDCASSRKRGWVSINAIITTPGPPREPLHFTLEFRYITRGCLNLESHHISVFDRRIEPERGLRDWPIPETDSGTAT